MQLPPLRPSAETIDDLLPQTECRQCGFEGCAAYAQAIAEGLAPINRCAPGGARGIRRLAAATGLPELPLDPEYGTEVPFARGCSLCAPACPMDCIDFVDAGRDWTDDAAKKAKANHEAAWARRVRRAALEDARLAGRRSASPAETRENAKKAFMADILAMARAGRR